MKKITLFFLFISLIFFCGFKRYEKPYIILSSGSITSENLKRIERVFPTGQRINIGLAAPDGFKDYGIRKQLSKQDDKTSNWGFSIIQSSDFYIDKTQNLYKDYIYIYRPGHYILQFFYINNKRYPFAHVEFKVI